MGNACMDSREDEDTTLDHDPAEENEQQLLPTSAQSDDCIVCMENLADVMFPCGHRIVCRRCDAGWRAKAELEGRTHQCPLDRQPIGEIGSVIDNHQYHPVIIAADRDGPRSYSDLVADKAVGFKLGTEPQPGDRVTPELLAEVQLAMSRVSAGELQFEELHTEMKHRLTSSQLVFVELSKNADLHCVMLQSESLCIEHYVVWKSLCRAFMIEVCEAQSWTEMTLPMTTTRAATTTLAATGVEILSEQTIVPGTAWSAGSVGAAGGAAGVVFLLFGGFELYRWSKGEIGSREAALNCGEHFVGGAASVGQRQTSAAYRALSTHDVGGLLAGGGIVAATGCAVPGVGIVLGFVLAVIFGLTARYGYRYHTADFMDEQKQYESRMRAVEGAALALGIDLVLDDFHVAKNKFRHKLLQTHPDKFTEGERAEKTQETASLLMWWQLVRGYYEGSLGGCCKDLDEDEGFISVFVKKMRETVHDNWHIVRTWIGPRDSEPVAQTELEIVEECRIYV